MVIYKAIWTATPTLSLSPVLFEIELLGFVEYTGAELDENQEREKTRSFEERLAIANSEREVGNDFFQQNMLGKATGKYLKVRPLSNLAETNTLLVLHFATILH